MANDLLYPVNARASAGPPRPLVPPPRRRPGGSLVLLLLLVGALGAGGWLRVVRPLEQKLALTTRLFTQASGRAAALQRKVTALEVEGEAASQAGAAAAARVGDLVQRAERAAALREALSARIAKLADQRRLQLLPHERGLAVHLPGWAPKAKERRGRGAKRHGEEDVVAALAAQIRRGLPAGGASVTATAFACCRAEGSGRRSACWRRADGLAGALTSALKGAPHLRVVAAVGPADALWSLPQASSSEAADCAVVDLRPE